MTYFYLRNIIKLNNYYLYKKSMINNFLKTLKSNLNSIIFKKKLNVLLWGNCARDHALAWKLSKSKRLKKLYLANPNDGFKHLGEVLDADGYKLVRIAKEKGIDLLVVGSEDAQISGIVDAFKEAGIKTIGVSKKWSILEASKSFAKEFMVRNNIATPKYKVITELQELENCIQEFGFPLVLKADGLALGFGVSIANRPSEARTILEEFLNGKFQERSKKVVIEEFIDGKEISLISLWDGKTLLPLLPVRDYKKLLEGNYGPNTAGIGSYCPVILNNKEQKEISEYLEKLKKALIKEKADFTGILYSGLIINESGLNVLEYNIRLGDPEGQALLMHLDSDLLELFDLTSRQKLSQANLKWKKGTSACVVLTNEGYPDNPKTGVEVSNINSSDIEVFFCGIRESEGKLLSAGGRVLSICKTSESPYNEIYKFIDEINFEGKYYRKDIGS